MRIIIILSFLILFSCSLHAEIKQLIDNFPIKYLRKTRIVSATFEFVTPPTAFEVVTINFKITNIQGSATPGVMLDRIIRISCVDSNVKLLSNSEEIWTGEHDRGDIYEGVIQCIPLSSGYYGIDVTLDNNPNSLFSVRWFLDENGDILYLNNPEIDQPKLNDYKYIDVKYFNSDSIYIKAKSDFSTIRDGGTLELFFPFMYEINMKPIPKIDDTSTVHIRLKANKDILNGMLLEISSSNLDIVSYPEKIDYPIIKDQIIDIFFDICPQPINGIESFDVLFQESDISSISKHQRIMVLLIFNNNKTLRYINDGVFNFRKHNILPTNFVPPHK